MAVTTREDTRVHLRESHEESPKPLKIVGISVPFPGAKRPFNLRQEQIILGTILGDGYLHKPTDRETNSRLVTSCCEKDEDYIFWKYQELSSSYLFPYPPKLSSTYLDGKEFKRWMIRSKNNIVFTEYRDLFYPQGRKIVPSKALEYLNDLGLAVWYMDDGSLSKKRYLNGDLANLKICTQCFTWEEDILIRDWFKERYKISPFRIQERGDNRYILRLSHGNSIKRFLSIVSPYVEEVKCMKRKIRKK